MQKKKTASLAVTKFSMLHVCVLGKQQVASTYSEKKKKQISTTLQAQFKGMGALACVSAILLCWLCLR